MASIDRYRPPPREGYQPPVLPANNNRPDRDRPSRSPSAKRREVPPAVPSPPTMTSRNSPPRSQSRLSASSPAHSAPKSPVAVTNQWFFTPDEVLSSPSILDGLSPTEERLRRAKGVNFIYQAGVLLELPQTTLYVAGVFFHRFYMRCSMVEEKHGVHHYNIAATALFLANKTEENCRKTKEVIIAVAKVAQKNLNLIVDEQSKEYWRWRDSILMYEEVMLENLTFDLMVDNPHIKLYEILGQLGVIHNKNLRHAAWAFCNDSCLTPLPLLMDARDIAIASIFFASTFTGEHIDDINGEPWWKSLNANEDHCSRAIKVLTEFYTENPLKKQENPYQGSPKFDLENTRRKADDSSTNATPRTDPDRGGTQTPPRASNKANGSDGDADVETNSKGVSSQTLAGDSTSKGTAADADSYSKDATSETVAAESASKRAAADTGSHSKDADSETLAAEAASKRVSGDSDAALKEAANNLSIHQGTSAVHSDSLVGSPRPNGKRKELENLAAAEEGPQPKRQRTESVRSEDDEDDEGEVHE
ncbi:hypothetical protein DL770_001097 [Monosporascus sp. CRB-9-2]|nr:hypothetical protein DL770_001097 [Monosporascus sp. CRB-9-2]